MLGKNQLTVRFFDLLVLSSSRVAAACWSQSGHNAFDRTERNAPVSVSPNLLAGHSGNRASCWSRMAGADAVITILPPIRRPSTSKNLTPTPSNAPPTQLLNDGHVRTLSAADGSIWRSCSILHSAVVGWATSRSIDRVLVITALRMALKRRRPPGELLSHSDRGSQYASNEYRAVLAENDVTCSMSGSGDCRNNAVVESFNGTIKRELINWNRWETRSAATVAIAEHIEGWYNLRRRHSEARVRQPRAV